MIVDEVPEEGPAVLVIELHHLDAEFGEPVMPTREVRGLANDECTDLELSNEPAAVPAGRERRHHHAIGVVSSPARVAERRRLGMGRGIVILNPAVMPAAEKSSVALEEGCADRDPALGEPCAGFLQGHREELAGELQVEWSARVRNW